MLTLIIVSYNSASVLEQCMDELLQSNRFRTIIVDNNSPDGSAEILKSRYPKAEMIALKQNIGYGRAANIGLEKIKSRYAFLLNPDLCARPSEINALVDWIEQKNLNAALYAPAVKTQDFLKQGAMEREWIIGAAMLFDMDRMKPIGGFDENIFLFYEEKDLCLRIRKANQKILICSDFYFDHLKGKACPPDEQIENIKNWHVGWSSMYYLTKHGINKGKHRASNLLLRYRYKSVLSLSQAKRRKFKGRVQGIKAFLAGDKAFLSDGTAQLTKERRYASSHDCCQN